MSEHVPPIQGPTQIRMRPPSFQRRLLAADTADPNTLVALASDESYFVRRQALENPNTPGWILVLLVRAGATPDLRGKGKIDPDLDQDSLRRLVETGPWAQQLVAEHPNTSADVLDALRAQPSTRLRLAVAAHPNANQATLASLCCDIEEDIRMIAVSNPKCPHDLQRLLMEAGAQPDLKGVTRGFEKLIEEQFSLLIALGAWGRFLAARHPDCPNEVLASISHDPAWQVGSGLLDNPKTPTHLIRQLLVLPERDDLETIRCLSQGQISSEILHRLAAHSRSEVRLSLARHPAATTEVLGLLATDGVNEIRRLAAAHPKTDPAVLERLVKAGSTPDLMGLSEPDAKMPAAEIRTLLEWGVWARQLAVRHPNTNADTAGHLLCDQDPKIREWAAVHLNLSPETKRDLIRAGSGTDFQGIMPADPSLPAERLQEIAMLGSWGERVVANNQYAPSTLLASLAQSPDWKVRQFVAGNPNTLPSTLDRLGLDSVKAVRLAVSQRQSREGTMDPRLSRGVQ